MELVQRQLTHTERNLALSDLARTTSKDWTETIYGRKRALANGNLQIQIDPGKHTGLGRADLDRFGLRPHPGGVYEHIKYLGFADGTADYVGVLRYDSRSMYGEVRNPVRYIKSGVEFASVCGEQGYWHINENIGHKPILLEIEACNDDSIVAFLNSRRNSSA